MIKRSRVEAVIEFESIYLGGKSPTLQVKVWEVLVLGQEDHKPPKRERLLLKRE